MITKKRSCIAASLIGVSAAIFIGLSSHSEHQVSAQTEHTGHIHAAPTNSADSLVAQAQDPSPEPYKTLPETTLRSAVQLQESNLRAAEAPSRYALSGSQIGPDFNRAVHIFELPDINSIMVCAGSGNSADRHAQGLSTCQVHDWWTTDRRRLKLPTDLFCGAGVYDAEGNLIFAGGTGRNGYPALSGNGWRGAAVTYKFDVSATQITRLGDMNEPRWYNGIFRNWYEGGIYTYGGQHEQKFSSTWEKMEDGSSTWSLLPWRLKTWNYADYKMIDATHAAFTGASSTNSTLRPHIVNLQTGQATATPGLRDADRRNGASAIMMYPAQNKKVAVFGGGSAKRGVQATNAVDIIDYGIWPAAVPSFSAASPMPTNVMFVLATNLPNGQVFVTGGTKEWRAGQVKWAAIYTPWDNTWTMVEPPKVGRNYHSAIYTRLDGRPVVFGGNPDKNYFESRSEVFKPWYEFEPAPVIGDFEYRLNKGNSYKFEVAMPEGKEVGYVTLDAPRATTHSSSDTNYGMFNLPATAVDGGVEVHVPSDNSIPSGWYKISVVTKDYIPSKVSEWIHIN